jgi:hypothetical protein
MSAAEFAEFAGWFLLAWSSGYVSGFLFLSVRKIFEASGL